MNCRHCKSVLEHTFLDLGFAPPSNSYLSEEQLNYPEVYFPLKIKVCDRCWLVQTEDHAKFDELFTSEYAYFSSTSSSWLEHARIYSEKIIEFLKLDGNSFVIEVAANDGYLLKNFVSTGIPCLGIEPTASTASAAEQIGIPIHREFFGEQLGIRLAREGRKADLIIGNNVYAHVPDINDFTRGLKNALKEQGVITLEFPHLLRLIDQCQFDTIYHEHFSYLSLHTVCKIFDAVGLRVWHVEELSTHGGSLRVYGCHEHDIAHLTQDSVSMLLRQEFEFGLQRLSTYSEFQQLANKIKNELLMFLIEKKMKGERVVAYGAAAKGNTLLNFAGVKPDLLPIVYDAASSKQGKFMPGSHIPILDPDQITSASPEYILILPWNIVDEVMKTLSKLPELNEVHYLVAVPELKEL
jgi:hypothetical protein